MDIKEITDFCFRNSSQWLEVMTKEQIEAFLNCKENKYSYLTDSFGTITIVCIYQTYKDEAHAYYVGIMKEALNGFKLMRRLGKKMASEENITRISWLNPEFKFRMMEV